MNISTLIEEYFLSYNQEYESRNYKISVFVSFLVYVVSIGVFSISHSIVFDLDVYSWISLMFTNFLISLFILLIFLIWTSFISSIFNKSKTIIKFVPVVFRAHYVYMLSLPISIICYYFNINYLFLVFQIILVIKIIKKILSSVKRYYDFGSLQMFFLVGLPFLILSMLMFLPLLLLGLYFYRIYKI
ncbi:MAG: hypothetical protein N2643_05225 [Endomicrobia bacterium]|nr:hypothetical protein [Endomicrobiia bacterium]